MESYFTDLQLSKQTERFDEHTGIFGRVSVLEGMVICLREAVELRKSENLHTTYRLQLCNKSCLRLDYRWPLPHYVLLEPPEGLYCENMEVVVSVTLRQMHP